MNSVQLKQALSLPLFAMACAAVHAQDSLTLYGVADMYGEGIWGSGHVARLQSGGLSASRLGFKGTEDLGGGLYANFTLESGLNFDDGSYNNGVLFGRQSFVGFGYDRAGTITLGRQYTGLWHITDEFSEFSNSSNGPSSAVVGGFGGYEPVRGSADSGTGSPGPARINNAIKYESPVWGGFRLGVQGGFGEVVNDAGGNRVFDGYARYTQGAIDIAAAMVDDKGGAVTPLANRRTYVIAAAYRVGDLRFRGAYLAVDDRAATNEDGSGWWIGADYRLGVNLIKIQYVENKPKYLDNAKTQALGVGYEYSLSKRTTLYSGLTYFKNQDNAGLGRASFSIPAGVTSTRDNDITQFIGGMRFTF